MRTTPRAFLLPATVAFFLAAPASAQPVPAASAPPAPAPDAPTETGAEDAPEAASPLVPTAPAPPPPPSEEPAPVSEPEPPPAPPEAVVEAPVATEAPTPGDLPLRVGGSFWSRYEARSGYADHGLTHPRLHREGDYIVSRARLNVSTNPVDTGGGSKVSATFVPQVAYTMGENTGAAPTVSDHPALGVYEAYVRLGSAAHQLDVGRFALNYGDALVLGNLGWNEAARSFNGARLHLTPGEEPYYVDVIGTLISDGRLQTGTALEGDRYLYGIYAGLGPLFAEGLDLDVYLLGHTLERDETIVVTDPMDDTVTAVGRREAATEVTLGARVKGKASIVDYRAEAGMQFGKSPTNPSFASLAPDAMSKLASQVDAELGVTPTHGLRLAVEGFYASGDDLDTSDKNEAYDDLYPTGHKFLGLSDVMGRRANVAGGALHLSYAAMEALVLSLDGHYFTRPQTDGDGVDGAVGSEIDVGVLYKIGAGASLRGLYAAFLPNEDYWEPKTAGPDEPGDAIHFFELQFGYDFK